MEPLSPQSTRPQKLSKSHQLSLILNMARSQELRAYKHLKLEPLNVLNVVVLSPRTLSSYQDHPVSYFEHRNFQNIGSTHRSISNNRCSSSVNILRKQKNVGRNFHYLGPGLTLHLPPPVLISNGVSESLNFLI